MSARCQLSAIVANRVIVAHTKQLRMLHIIAAAFVFEAQLEASGDTVEGTAERTPRSALHAKQG